MYQRAHNDKLIDVYVCTGGLGSRVQSQEEDWAPPNRFWRWRGHLIHYVELGSSDPNAPAIVLTHGFGAMGEHYRSNMGPLAAANFRVFAPTVIGFGRSEKPLVDYSQDLWTEFLRDFTLEVVRTPAVVVSGTPDPCTTVLVKHGTSARERKGCGELERRAREQLFRFQRVSGSSTCSQRSSSKELIKSTWGSMFDEDRNTSVEPDFGGVAFINQVGNSIGGFFAASLAGDYPQLVTGCVLLNSAGRIVPDYTPDATAAEPARSPVSVTFRRRRIPPPRNFASLSILSMKRHCLSPPG